MKVGTTFKGLDPLPGSWSVWSAASDGPGAVFVLPHDQKARELGLKFAVVRRVSTPPGQPDVLTVLRTDPSRPDLCGTPTEREKRTTR